MEEAAVLAKQAKQARHDYRIRARVGVGVWIYHRFCSSL